MLSTRIVIPYSFPFLFIFFFWSQSSGFRLRVETSPSHPSDRSFTASGNKARELQNVIRLEKTVLNTVAVDTAHWISVLHDAATATGII